jgi:hypothetical protein
MTAPVPDRLPEFIEKTYTNLCEKHGIAPYPIKTVEAMTKNGKKEIKLPTPMMEPQTLELYFPPSYVQKNALGEDEIGAIAAHEHSHGDQFRAMSKTGRVAHAAVAMTVHAVGTSIFAVAAAASAAHAGGILLDAPDISTAIRPWVGGAFMVQAATLFGYSLYRKHLEHDADRRAVLMTRHRGLEKFYRRKEQRGFIINLVILSGFFVTHPTDGSRIRRVTKLGNKLGLPPLPR